MCRSVPEQALKAGWREFGISHCVLDRLVPQIALDGARIDAVVRQFVTAAMPQHVRVNFHGEPGSAGHTLHHRLEAAC
jgi:hypothetical protein